MTKQQKLENKNNENKLIISNISKKLQRIAIDSNCITIKSNNNYTILKHLNDFFCMRDKVTIVFNTQYKTITKEIKVTKLNLAIRYFLNYQQI